jgi:hypothetical protein
LICCLRFSQSFIGCLVWARCFDWWLRLSRRIWLADYRVGSKKAPVIGWR